MANNNRQQNKPAAQSRGRFYGVLLAIIVIGAGAIYYAKHSNTRGPQEPSEAYEAMRKQYANAGPPQPYVRGKADAPVIIEEFADYECPSCGSFATVTEPDVRKNLVDAGLAQYKFYDFPLPMHHNSPSASLAAACADEQGKFWEMHDQLFATQDQWGLATGTSEVTDNPGPIFKKIAQGLGLNMQQWQQCYDSKKYEARVIANAAEAVRRNVEQTPTFFINGEKIPGAIPYDQLKAAVDRAAKRGPMSATDSALGNIMAH